MTKRLECPFEQLLREAGYIQTYDGQTAVQKAGDQFNLLPEERRFFIRRYQQVRNNKFTNKWAVLKFDLRTGWCIECNVVKQVIGMPKQEQRMVSNGVFSEDLTKE